MFTIHTTRYCCTSIHLSANCLTIKPNPTRRTLSQWFCHIHSCPRHASNKSPCGPPRVGGAPVGPRFKKSPAPGEWRGMPPAASRGSLQPLSPRQPSAPPTTLHKPVSIAWSGLGRGPFPLFFFFVSPSPPFSHHGRYNGGGGGRSTARGCVPRRRGRATYPRGAGRLGRPRF